MTLNEMATWLLQVFRATNMNIVLKCGDGFDDINIDGWVTVHEKDQGGKLAAQDWIVSVIRHVPQTREEPEDVDVEEVLQSANKYEVAKKVIDLVIANRLDCLFQGMDQEEAYREEQAMYDSEDFKEQERYRYNEN